jgi:hypothetical protein
MDLSKQKLIGWLELMVTLFLVYFNWIAFFNTQNTINSSLIIGMVNFMTILLFLMATSPIYFSTFNPVITLYLYFFNQISRKQVLLLGKDYGDQPILGRSNRGRFHRPPRIY